MGLCPKPRDLALSRQDFLDREMSCAHTPGIPASESALGLLRLRRALPSAQVRSVYQGCVYKTVAVYTKCLTRPVGVTQCERLLLSPARPLPFAQHCRIVLKQGNHARAVCRLPVRFDVNRSEQVTFGVPVLPAIHCTHREVT
jgi:hypothetical protein